MPIIRLGIHACLKWIKTQKFNKAKEDKSYCLFELWINPSNQKSSNLISLAHNLLNQVSLQITYTKFFNSEHDEIKKLLGKFEASIKDIPECESVRAGCLSLIKSIEGQKPVKLPQLELQRVVQQPVKTFHPEVEDRFLPFQRLSALSTANFEEQEKKDATRLKVEFKKAHRDAKRTLKLGTRDVMTEKMRQKDVQVMKVQHERKRVRRIMEEERADF